MYGTGLWTTHRNYKTLSPHLLLWMYRVTNAVHDTNDSEIFYRVINANA